jgi:hypothetical protein
MQVEELLGVPISSGKALVAVIQVTLTLLFLRKPI